MNYLVKLFKIEKTPHKGLFALEWVVLGYMVLTLLVILFAYTKVQNPESMVWGRVRIGAMTVALWIVYRLVPCRFTRLVRVVAQMALLSWWYPDTYELNRMFTNLDHLFASFEQQLFGCQPALLFSQKFPSHIISELMDMGYAAYYPMIVLVVLFYFFRRYEEFERASFIVLASFFVYYVVFVFVPVAGPTFYYKAVGLHDITHGVFPNIHDYFNYNTDCLPAPGYTDGFFYDLVESAKNAGERPTAAFPSSHVGVSTVLMLLAWHSKSRRLFFGMLPFYVFLCMATVYIQAHYATDAIAGFLSAVALYWVLLYFSKGMKHAR